MNLWINKVLARTFHNHLVKYPSPININYLWGFGSLAGVCLGIQIVTGILLAMHYVPNVSLAFSSVEHIMRDVNYGWLLRYAHANGASMFFLVVYIHMFRGLYYGSYMYPRQVLWISGVVIFILMMATAFMGYVLPWGQMSFWAATVITNLFSAIPIIGDYIVQWIWGGFSVNNATLNRFFSFHYFFPFVIAGVVFLHLILLHENGSNNPLGTVSYDMIPFYPYFYVKDLFGFFVLLIIFGGFLFFAPNFLGHPDNYIQANPMVTPAHIVPEWYFLPFYAILRSIPNKLLGVICMFAALIVLIILPFLTAQGKIRSAEFKPIYRKFFWLFFVDSVLLGWVGQKVVEYPYVEIGQVATFFYLFYFLVLIPITSYFDV